MRDISMRICGHLCKEKEEKEMSQHPSLRSNTKDIIQRSVLKRHERLKEMDEKEKWDENKPVYGLPKLKVMKFKIKKEKPQETAEGAEGQVAAAGAAAETASAKDSPKAEVKGKAEKKK